jgi:hypothetical protein
MSRRLGLLMVVVLSPSLEARAADAPPAALSQEIAHPSGAFTFRVPAGWATGPAPTNPKLFQANGDGLVVRFYFEPQEVGHDALHTLCMLERLAGEAETDPRVAYEYDFLSGVVAEREVIDSAFVVKYNAKILGSLEWRQRNVTLVGKGQSLCVMTYAPAQTWKKSKAVRTVLDGIVGSLVFRTKPSPAPAPAASP